MPVPIPPDRPKLPIDCLPESFVRPLQARILSWDRFVSELNDCLSDPSSSDAFAEFEGWSIRCTSAEYLGLPQIVRDLFSFRGDESTTDGLFSYFPDTQESVSSFVQQYLPAFATSV